VSNKLLFYSIWTDLLVLSVLKYLKTLARLRDLKSICKVTKRIIVITTQDPSVVGYNPGSAYCLRQSGIEPDAPKVWTWPLGSNYLAAMFSLLSKAEEDFNHWNWLERSLVPRDLKFPTLALGDRMESAQIAPESHHDSVSNEIEARTSTLKYEPLFTVKSEIRLLILHESSSKDRAIECTLQKVNLDDEPRYFALSYVWGDPSVTLNVTVNDCMVPIRSNLFSALRNIRQVYGRTIIWVDAICEPHAACWVREESS
jgi:hypothetical protein